MKISRRYLYMAMQMSKQEQTAIEKVNELVANQGVFFVKLHQYHWYVQGPHFFTLHEKFEELYNDSNEYFDAFEERLINFEEIPYTTLRDYIDVSSIH